MNTNISRRNFLNIAGGLSGALALSAMGMNNGWEENKPKINSKDTQSSTLKTDVLVIGGGMAGLFAAVKAYDAGSKVLLVSKGRLGASGQTPFAKGIFEYDAATSKYSIDDYVNAVNRSAIGTNNPAYTRQVAEHSKARVAELRQWGFFDSAIYNKAFMVPINERNIPLLERITITHLIKENGQIAGAAGFSIDDNKFYFIQAKSVILCTGAGGFKPNGFPINDLTHDGTIMAYNIGAKVTGKEWNDGHPGQATNAAACYDGWHGMFDRKPGTVGVEIHHDLGVDLNYLAYVNGNPVQMGHPGSNTNKTTALKGPYIPEEFSHQQEGNKPDGENDRQGPPKNGKRPKDGERPKNGKRPDKDGKRPDKDGGGPPGMAGVSVGGSSAGMAIHKSEGLVPIDDKCASTIPGLYAAGDALGSYMAGAIYTQIGSSLAGSAVQGAIAGEAAANYSKTTSLVKTPVLKVKTIKEEIFAPLKRESGYSPTYVTQTLQGIIIPNFVLYIKKEKMLQAALSYVEELRDHHLPLLKAADLHELRLCHETVNMVISAEMKLKASLMRTESRCSHYRLDYPDLDDKNWQAWINIFKGKDGEMQFEKQDFIAPINS